MTVRSADARPARVVDHLPDRDGPREGQKVFTLQMLPPEPGTPRSAVAESSGFSLHAGLAAKASQRDKLTPLKFSQLPLTSS